MIRYLYSDELKKYEHLFHGMFTHRAEQFYNRLKWDLVVDENGWERDLYDDLNPLYLIIEDDCGNHAGSMRFLPTTGATILYDHFAHIAGKTRFRSPYIWECSRFCLAPKSPPHIKSLLVASACAMGNHVGLSCILGVFDTHMKRIYKHVGWSPTILGENDRIAVGLWEFSKTTETEIKKKCPVTSHRLISTDKIRKLHFA